MSKFACSPGDVLVMNRFGFFGHWRPPGFTLSADDAVSISSAETNNWTESFGKKSAHTLTLEMHNFRGLKDWVAVLGQIHWGQTTRPDMVYYELWSYGNPMTRELGGFHHGALVGEANVINEDALIVATEKIELRFWNVTGDHAQEAWVEAALSLYWFPLVNKDLVLRLSQIGLVMQRPDCPKYGEICQDLGFMP